MAPLSLSTSNFILSLPYTSFHPSILPSFLPASLSLTLRFLFYPICQDVKCLVLSHPGPSTPHDRSPGSVSLLTKSHSFAQFVVCCLLLRAFCACSFIGVESFRKALNFAPPV